MMLKRTPIGKSRDNATTATKRANFANPVSKSNPPKQSEAKMQSECVKWFRYSYSHLKLCLFAIPNGGSRNIIEAANLKKQGVLAGVGDLFMMVARKGYHGLFLEAKIDKGKLTEAQESFGIEALNQNYSYQVFRNFDQFRMIVENYLSNK